MPHSTDSQPWSSRPPRRPNKHTHAQAARTPSAKPIVTGLHEASGRRRPVTERPRRSGPCLAHALVDAFDGFRYGDVAAAHLADLAGAGGPTGARAKGERRSPCCSWGEGWGSAVAEPCGDGCRTSPVWGHAPLPLPPNCRAVPARKPAPKAGADQLLESAAPTRRARLRVPRRRSPVYPAPCPAAPIRKPGRLRPGTPEDEHRTSTS